MQDPPVVPPNPSPDAFWNSFDARAITQTAIPADATLTVSYWDGSQWIVLPGAENLPGPDVVNIVIPMDLRDDIEGLRFDFHDPGGFPPGTTVQPNFSAELRDDRRDGSGPAAGEEDTIADCAGATATAGDVTGSAMSPCPTVTLTPVTPGSGDLMDKEFAEPEPGAGKTVIARSGDHIDARLHWSTGGYSGLDEVVLSDTANPETTAVADSYFDAFDLGAVPAITVAQDPWLTYDAVSRVELWNGSAWVRASADPCPGACDGTFPGVTLTQAEQDTTTGVRLVFVESPTRADRIGDDPTLPQVGEGVSRSSGSDRTVTLTFELRDTARDPQSTPDPVLGTREYNVDGSPGLVDDTARATGYTDGAQVATDVDNDQVTIVDVPLNVDIAKDWTGGPLGIPPAGTDPDAYPSGRVSITATNATAAKVDTMTVTDPGAAAGDPSDVFDVADIVTISLPVGTESSTVTLLHADGSTTEHTVDAALALTETELADVVGITVVHTGRINAGATANVVWDARLRATHRSSGDPVTEADSPVTDIARATVADLGGTDADTPSADDAATMEFTGIDISVQTTKAFDPDEITEPAKGPVLLFLTGQPGGSTRTNRMVITDDDPSLWNQYDFADFALFTFAAPIDRVQVDAFTGATYTAGPDGVVATGGSWTDGTPATTLALPSGVNAADVQGLRFTFTRADGDIWENPATPFQMLRINLTRRDDMRTGGPVPSDLSTNDPAPGETAPGIATNTVETRVEGAVIVGGQPVSATDTDDATILYKHAANGVEIVKLADGAANGGVKPPGNPFPYTIEVTNTGDRAIVDPVVRDVLPSDATGPLLQFDPLENPGGEGAFAYALTGDAPDPPGGPAMPTDPAQVGTDITGDVEEIAFTFPSGTVLEVGQKYTITVQLMIRPGVAGGTEVTNTAGVTDDRPWDECVDTLDATTGECRASATVDVSSAGALRSMKRVRAVDTELGEHNVNDENAECVPGSEGFFVLPCVPITKPGGDEIWRLHTRNTGNLAMTDVVGVDQLPAPGDTGAINDNPRGSQWRPLFEGTITPISGVPAGADVTFWWTDDAEPCAEVLTCPPEAWTLFPEDGGPAFTEEILRSVMGIRYRVVFPEGDLFEPLDDLIFDMTTTTPAFSPTEGPDTIAWNSVAAAGLTTEGGRPVEAVVPMTEGVRVGVALATGSLAVRKEVAGPGAAYAPAEFDLTLNCTSAVGTRVEEEVDLGDKAAITVKAGETVTVTDLPYDAECTVTEDEQSRPSSFTATTVNVDREDQTVPVIVATNTYELAGIVVRKAVESGAVDADGNAITYGPFTIEVDCTFLGETVYGTGYDVGNPMTAELDAGEEAVFTGIPARSGCTATETDTKDSTEVTVTTTRDGDDPAITKGPAATVELAPDAGGVTDNTMVFVNAYGAGAIAIKKFVFGQGADPVDEGPFTVAVTCTLDDASGKRVVWDGTVILGGGLPLEAVIDDVAAGAVCDISEPVDGGANLVVILPKQVTVGADETVNVRVVNVLATGSLLVTKEVIGDGAELYGGGPFEVSLACTFDTGGETVGVDVPGGPTREVTVDGPAFYESLPAGSECVLTETATGGANSTAITGGDPDPATVTIPVRDQAELTVTNSFDTGGLTVTKEVTGTGADAHSSKEFTVELTCTREVDGETVDVKIPGGAERTVTPGGTVTYADLPAGAACRLAETDDGGADSAGITVGGQETADVAITACESGVCDDATVTNTFEDVPMAVTGADNGRNVLLALTLILGGAALLVVARRRIRR